MIGRERVRILVGFSKALGQERLANYQKNITPKIELGRIGGDQSQQAVLGNSLVEYLRKQGDLIQALRNRILDVELKLTNYKTAMALHVHTGFGLGVVQTVPSIRAAAEGILGTAGFYGWTNPEAALKTHQQSMQDLQALGTEDGAILGTLRKRILSSTVYIGK